MKPNTIAVVAPGDMGHAVANVLRHNGLNVITNLAGRSGRSRNLAAKAGLIDVGDDAAMVSRADIFLSILPPDQALVLARRMAPVIADCNSPLLYADCNATSPATTKAICQTVSAAGAACVDVAILGAPPTPEKATTRFYVSGGAAGEFAELKNFGLDVRPIGPELGRASALKMCFAAVTKGAVALATEALVASTALGVDELVLSEFRSSQGKMIEWAEGRIKGMPPKAYRWIGEMHEIAETFNDVGLTPKMLQGAGDVFEFVKGTPMGGESPETWSRNQLLEDIIANLGEHIVKN